MRKFIKLKNFYNKDEFLLFVGTIRSVVVHADEKGRIDIFIDNGCHYPVSDTFEEIEIMLND